MPAPPGLSRRHVLAAGGAAAAVSLLPLGAAPPARATSPGEGYIFTGSHWGAFYAKAVDGRVTDIVPFERDRYPTTMIRAFPELVHSRTRITQPMVRAGFLADGADSDTAGRGREPFVPVDWDTALDLVAAELQRVKDTYGNPAIFGGSYGWASAARLHHAPILTNRFLAMFGGYVEDIANYSYGAGMVLLPHIIGGNQAIGGPLTTWPNIIAHTELIVMFGGAGFSNGQITSQGSGVHTTEHWFREAAAARIPMLSINPIRVAETKALGAEWLPIRPTGDVALMLALCHTLYTEGRHDAAFLARYTEGFERFLPYLTGAEDGQPKDADWAAGLTDLPAETIRTLARRMAARRTMIMTSWSLQRAEHGEQPWWMTIVLAAMLGQIGLPGGGFGFSYTSTNGIGQPRASVSIPTIGRGRNPVRSRIPVARIVDMLERPGGTVDFNGMHFTYPDTRLIYWAGGNPFHHHQDLNRLLAAWRKPETVIVHEPWWTATARHADIVLPATTTFERNDISASIRDRYIVAIKQVVPPQHQARNDFDIFAALADRLGFGAEFTEGKAEMAWLEELYEEGRAKAAASGTRLPPFRAFWEAGFVDLPEGDRDYVFLADYRADPEAARLFTASGRIEIFSQEIADYGYACCAGHPKWYAPREWLGAAAEGELHMLSPHPSHRLHSQMDNGPVAGAVKVQGREPLLMNPADAAARGLADGQVVRVHNARGACLAGLVVTDDIRPGVIALAEGAWYDPAEPGVQGTLDKQGNANALTRDIGTSKLTQGCAAQSVLVRVAAATDVPPVTIYDPPPIRPPEAPRDRA